MWKYLSWLFCFLFNEICKNLIKYFKLYMKLKQIVNKNLAVCYNNNDLVAFMSSQILSY